MNFNTVTKDPNGNPVPDIIIRANVLDGPPPFAGTIYSRSSDGSGISSIFMADTPLGLDVLLTVEATGYALWTNMGSGGPGPLKTTTEDQSISITLVPFA